MRLTLERLHLYLLDKGYLAPASLLGGDYLATQMQTRNLIFCVTRREAKSLFVKQLISFDPSNTYALQKDATCLWLIKNHPAFAQLSGYVPDYFGFDAEKQVLVTEYLPGARNLEEHVRQHQGHLPPPVSEALAAALASYHFELGPEVRRSRPAQFLPQQVPWVLQLADGPLSGPQAMPLAAGGPNPVVSAVLGSADFRQALSRLQLEWTATSLIHGDLKWLNLLLLEADGQPHVKLIDWEIADIGDPLWDVAGVLQGFVTNLVLYDPVVSAEAFGLVPGLGLSYLQAVWPAMDYFWQHYLRHAPAADPADLTKALRYTGARLVQTAIEHNMLHPTLQPVVVKLLQASYAILTGVPAILPTFTAAPAAVFA